MKKIGLIALALVLSLGLMGAGLAYWTETLDISGSVATGELDAEFTNYVFTLDPYTTGSCALSDTQADGDMDKADITIGNMYPDAQVICDLTVNNNGTIPMKITGVPTAIASGSEGYITVTVTSYTTADIASGDDGIVTLAVLMPSTVTDGELSTYSFSATVNIEQFNA